MQATETAVCSAAGVRACGLSSWHGCGSIELFADMAKAWLEDEVAVEDKAEAYYEHIVR